MLGIDFSVTGVISKLVCLIQHANCRHSLLVAIKFVKWGVKLPACLHVWPLMLVVPCIGHSHTEVLTYSPSLAELASVVYFIRTSWTMFSFNHRLSFFCRDKMEATLQQTRRLLLLTSLCLNYLVQVLCIHIWTLEAGHA